MQLMRVKEKKNKLSPTSIIMLVLLVVYCLTIFYSLYWTLITSFKVGETTFRFDMFGFPNYAKYKLGFGLKDEFGDPVYENLVATQIINAEKEGSVWLYTYRHVLESFTISVESSEVNVLQMYCNSLLYSIGCAITNTLVPCVTAYLCARYNFKLSKIVRSIVIIVMVIPIVGSMPSEIRLVKALGIIDTVYGLWIMKANFLGLYFLVFYDYFKAMPAAFSEAAKIDGASNWQIMMKIAMPLAKNTIFTILLILFVQFWNDYQAPMVYMSSYPTISRGLNELMARNYEAMGAYNPSEVPSKMAAVVYTALPVTILFLVFQKRLMGNLTMGGVKG